MTDQEKTDQEKVDDFYNEVLNDAPAEGSYCIIIFVREDKQVRYVYKNISNFKEKVLKDIEHIDPMHQILFWLWIFD